MDFKSFPKREMNGGVQYLTRFNNGYGASIIQHSFSYGHERGLWELAVIFYPDDTDEYVLSYSTPITDDVLGHLTEGEVNNYLNKISEL